MLPQIATTRAGCRAGYRESLFFIFLFVSVSEANKAQWLTTTPGFPEGVLQDAAG